MHMVNGCHSWPGHVVGGGRHVAKLRGTQRDCWGIPETWNWPRIRLGDSTVSLIMSYCFKSIAIVIFKCYVSIKSIYEHYDNYICCCFVFKNALIIEVSMSVCQLLIIVVIIEMISIVIVVYADRVPTRYGWSYLP